MNYSGALSPPSSTSSIVPLAPAGMIPIAYDSQWSIINGVAQTVKFQAVTAKISVTSNARTTRTVASCTAADYCIDSTLPGASPITLGQPRQWFQTLAATGVRDCRLQRSPPDKSSAAQQPTTLGNHLAEYCLLSSAARQSELRRVGLCLRRNAAPPSTGTRGRWP